MPRYRSSLRASITFASALALAVSSPALARPLPFLTGTQAGLLTGADSLATADFDGDGDLDFAAANSAIDKVVWMEATPAGFVEHTITTALDAPVDVAAADIDCDGDSDLVVAVFNTGSVVWERNDSGATSWALGGTISSTIGGVFAVATGKLTANDTVDVVAATLSGADEIVAFAHPSCSSAVWNTAVVSSALSGATDVLMADTNADGITDVVAAFTGRVAVFEHGAGNSFTRVDVDTLFAGAQAVAVGDVDRDGDLDVAATGNAVGQVAWWANPGPAGAWTKSTVGSLASAAGLALGDVDVDGDLDVVASSSSSSVPLHWWDNVSGDGSVWTAQELDATPGAGRRVATVDADGDGDADVVAAALAAGVRVYENDSTHRSAELGSLEHLFYPYGTGGQIVDLTHADVDGDGLLDVVVVWQGSTPAEHTVQWYAGIGGSPTSGVLQIDSLAHTIQTAIVTAFESVAMGDIDRDGDADAFVGHKWFPAQTYSYCRNDGGGTAWSCFSVGDVHWLVDAIELADVDADRDLDVVAVVQESSGGAWLVLWWENAGDPTLDADWIRHDIASDGPFDKLRVVDLDGDVDLDVVAGATWWRNDGGSPPVWVAQSIPNVWDPSFGMSSWALADIDVDGDLDIAAESPTSGLLWSRNNLPAGWVASEFLTPTPAGGPLGDFAFGDLDGDGDPDLVAGMMQTAPPQPRVSWWENDTRTGPFEWTEHALEPRGASASRLQVADFDRDGDPDLVMAANGEFVSWFNGGGQVALEARSMSGPALRDGLEEPVLAIDAYHRGRVGEAAAELASVSLLFEASPGTPLTQPQLEALVDAVRLYRDDGSGAFDLADTMVGEAGSMTLAAGEGVLDLADGLAALQHAPAETPAVYFLTLDMTPAASLAGVPTLRVTHTPGTPCLECDQYIPAEGSAAENASFDVPLVQEVALQRTASFAVVADTFGGDGFADGFESGATLVWSATTP